MAKADDGQIIHNGSSYIYIYIYGNLEMYKNIELINLCESYRNVYGFFRFCRTSLKLSQCTEIRGNLQISRNV